MVPENHAAIEIYAEWVRKGGYTRGGSRVPSLETGGRGEEINLLEISRLWMEETFNSQDPFV